MLTNFRNRLKSAVYAAISAAGFLVDRLAHVVGYWLARWRVLRRRWVFLHTFRLLRRIPHIVSVVERWILEHELPRKFHRIQDELNWEEYHLLVRQACDLIKAAPQLRVELLGKSRDVYLALTGGHPSFFYLWQRLLLRAQLLPEAFKGSKLRVVHLIESHEDLYLPMSGFSGLLTLGVYAALQFVGTCQRVGPGLTLKQREGFRLNRFFQLAEELIGSDSSEHGLPQWEKLEVGDLFVAAFCMEAVLHARDRLNNFLARYTRPKCWDIFNPGPRVIRRETARQLREHFQKEVVTPLSRLTPLWVLVDPQSTFDVQLLAPVLSILARRLPQAWKRWLSWELGRRLLEPTPQSDGIKQCLRRLAESGVPEDLDLVLGVLTNVLAPTLSKIRQGVNGTANLPPDLLELMAIVLIRLAQVSDAGYRSPFAVAAQTGPELLRTASNSQYRRSALFVRQIRALLARHVHGSWAELQLGGLILECICRAAKHEGLAVDELERRLRILPLRRITQDWISHAVRADPELRQTFAAYRRGQVVPSRQELRHQAQATLRRWFASSAEPDDFAEPGNNGTDVTLHVRKSAATIASSDKKLASLCRLAAIKVLCRLRQNLQKGGV